MDHVQRQLDKTQACSHSSRPRSGAKEEVDAVKEDKDVDRPHPRKCEFLATLRKRPRTIAEESMAMSATRVTTIGKIDTQKAGE